MDAILSKELAEFDDMTKLYSNDPSVPSAAAALVVAPDVKHEEEGGHDNSFDDASVVPSMSFVVATAPPDAAFEYDDAYAPTSTTTTTFDDDAIAPTSDAADAATPKAYGAKWGDEEDALLLKEVRVSLSQSIASISSLAHRWPRAGPNGPALLKRTLPTARGSRSGSATPDCSSQGAVEHPLRRLLLLLLLLLLPRRLPPVLPPPRRTNLVLVVEAVGRSSRRRPGPQRRTPC
jgi:hypothetical protein